MNDIFDDIQKEGAGSLETDEQFEALINGEQEENPGDSSPEETKNEDLSVRLYLLDAR